MEEGGRYGDWGSHLASVLALCPGASSTFARQKACQELEVTLCKVLYSQSGFTGVKERGEDRWGAIKHCSISLF